MKVETFLICDAATEAGGKLNVLGGFDVLHAQKMPATHPHCAVAVRMRFSRVEEGKHTIRINFVDEDGKEVLPKLETRLDVHLTDGNDSVAKNLILGINGFKLPQYGRYAIDLAIDGRHEASIPLLVKEPPNGAQAN